jgi:hypothetical protein
MFRRLAIIVALAGIGATAALAAPLTGKVQSTAADTVVVIVNFEKIEWVKKGASVRLVAAEKGAVIGKCVIISAADSTVTLLAPKTKAKGLAPGAAVTLDKPKAGMTGC